MHSVVQPLLLILDCLRPFQSVAAPDFNFVTTHSEFLIQRSKPQIAQSTQKVGEERLTSQIIFPRLSDIPRIAKAFQRVAKAFHRIVKVFQRVAKAFPKERRNPSADANAQPLNLAQLPNVAAASRR